MDKKLFMLLSFRAISACWQVNSLLKQADNTFSKGGWQRKRKELMHNSQFLLYGGVYTMLTCSFV